MSYAKVAMAFLAFSAVMLLIYWHMQAVSDAYDNGRVFERQKISEATTAAKLEEEVKVKEVQEKEAKIKIIYREKIRYAKQTNDAFLDCRMSDDLFVQLRDLHSGTSGAGVD